MSDPHEKSPYAIDILSPQRNTPPPFDFERLTRFMSFGFIMSPLQFKWFSFLSRAFPITKESAALPALKRVAFDQLIWAPLGMVSGPFPLSYTHAGRFGNILHLHDCLRGWRETSAESEVPRRIFAIPESQLYGMAAGTNPQFPSDTVTVPNCIYPAESLWDDSIANRGFSHSYRLSASPGQHTFH